MQRVFDASIRVANSPGLLATWASAVLLGTSVAYALVEGVRLDEALWWAVVTAFTVGYGDTYPESALGRALGVFLILTMWLLLQVFAVANVAARLIVNRDAFTHEEQEQIKTLLIRLAEKEGVDTSPAPTPGAPEP